MSEGEEELADGPLMAGQRDLPEQEDNRTCSERLRECCHMTGHAFQRCLQHKNTRLLVAVILGQFLSLLLCGTGVTSQLLESRHGVAVPTSQTFVSYVLLGAVYGVLVVVRSDFLSTLKQNWWKYIILGVVDVEANYMVVLAYKYTNLTTVQLLDSFTIASVMVLSFFFLRARYKIINFMGVSLSIVGILSLVLADNQGSRANRGSNPLLGDLLCLGGSLLYAISNVAQEFLVKKHSIAEYLGFIGVTGSVASAIQLIVLERKTLARIEWSWSIGTLMLGFGTFQFLFYSLVPHLLKLTSAVVFNLSLLTADIFTLLFGLFLFHYSFSFFYLLSFILILTGVFIYNLRQPSTAKKKNRDTKKETEKKQDGEAKGEEISELRRAFFESHTYEMSESKEASAQQNNHHHHQTKSQAAAPSPTKPSNLVGKLTSKLASKLPDQSGMASNSKRKTRTFDDLAEEERGADVFGASKEGLIRERSSSSGSYGSVENKPSQAAGAGGGGWAKRRNRRNSSTSAAAENAK